MTKLKVLFLLIFKFSLANWFLKMMSSQKNFEIFNILVIFRLMSHTHVHICIVLLHWIQNPTQNLRNSQDYTWSSISPSLLPIAVLFYSGSRYQVFLLETLVYLMTVSTADYFPLLPSFVICRKDNLGPNHIFLFSDWWLALLLWVLLSEEPPH